MARFRLFSHFKGHIKRGISRVRSNDNRVHFHRGEVEIESVVFKHSVAEHLPEQIATELRQRGVYEQVLFFKSLGKRTARP